jgi:hypothetical protein
MTGPGERGGRARRKGKVIPFPGTRPPAARDADPAQPEEQLLVEVHRCSQAEAVIACSLFESEGIPVVIRSHVSHSVHPFTVGAQGQAIIFVPAPEAQRARTLLARLATGPSFP